MSSGILLRFSFYFYFEVLRRSDQKLNDMPLCCQREFCRIQWHPTREKTSVLMVDGSFHGVQITVYMQNWQVAPSFLH